MMRFEQMNNLFVVVRAVWHHVRRLRAHAYVVLHVCIAAFV